MTFLLVIKRMNNFTQKYHNITMNNAKNPSTYTEKEMWTTKLHFSPEIKSGN